jgi:oligopeptide transport system permease protein
MSTEIVQSLPQSPGVWKQAWLRLKNDRVGMVSLYVTLFFIVLVLAAQLGLVAGNWQKEVGVPFAAPTLVGKIADGTQNAVVETVTGPNVDISDVDPLASRYKEWAERAAQFKTEVTVKADTLPFGADQQGRDVLCKVIKGAQVSITVGLQLPCLPR